MIYLIYCLRVQTISETFPAKGFTNICFINSYDSFCMHACMYVVFCTTGEQVARQRVNARDSNGDGRFISREGSTTIPQYSSFDEDLIEEIARWHLAGYHGLANGNAIRTLEGNRHAVYQ